MKYNTLGKSDIEVSEISFGCMSLELEKGQQAATSLIRKAYDSGINFFDTADLYDQGLNEEMVGTALNPIRSEVKIATKVGNVWKDDGSGWDWNPTKEHILTEVNESLRRLQTDYIDLYMLHGGTIEDPIDDIIEAFEKLKKHGKIRAYGISSIRPNTIREYVERSNMDVVMMQYSLLDRRSEEESLDLLSENDISVITRGTLAKGLLIDKEPAEYLDYSKEDVHSIQKAANETENAISASVQFVLEHPAVASSVLGIRTEQQLDEILKAHKTSISSKEIESVKQVLAPNKYTNHL
ncbi:MAG: oxidoreductase [Balneola sp.]|jgi:aryl-alcohol dehydrogenase-like predicted oxidoreductase|nr:oxidoreductase [Balneola sp.]MBE80296.1 oxidoreductase [Balneola sp.]HBX65610.1 oxidoreductase [Balneolaceae bacterium]|tara:strand:+ start:472 stop:1359 length:888 start_codon:yes stop_codon:yes gene_type:complete